MFCPGLGEQISIWPESWPSLLQTYIFLAFSVTLKQNIKQISCLQVPNLMLCVSTILYI